MSSSSIAHHDEKDRVGACDECLCREQAKEDAQATARRATVRKPANASERKWRAAAPLRRSLRRFRKCQAAEGRARRQDEVAALSRRRRPPWSPPPGADRPGPARRIDRCSRACYYCVRRRQLAGRAGERRRAARPARAGTACPTIMATPRRSRTTTSAGRSSETTQTPRSGDEAGTDEVGDDHHGLPRVAVGERGGERARPTAAGIVRMTTSDTDCRGAAWRRTRRRATATQIGPVTEHRERPGELDPPQVRRSGRRP